MLTYKKFLIISEISGFADNHTKNKSISLSNVSSEFIPNITRSFSAIKTGKKTGVKKNNVKTALLKFFFCFLHFSILIIFCHETK